MISNQRVLSIAFTYSMLLVSAVILFLSFTQLNPEVASVPKLISIAVIAMCIVSLIKEVKSVESSPQDAAKGDGDEDSPAQRIPWWCMLVLSILYTVLIQVLGFFVATILFLVIVPYLHGFKKWTLILIYGISFLIIYWIGFEKLMQIRFPSSGIFF